MDEHRHGCGYGRPETETFELRLARAPRALAGAPGLKKKCTLRHVHVAARPRREMDAVRFRMAGGDEDTRHGTRERRHGAQLETKEPGLSGVSYRNRLATDGDGSRLGIAVDERGGKGAVVRVRGRGGEGSKARVPMLGKIGARAAEVGEFSPLRSGYSHRCDVLIVLHPSLACVFVGIAEPPRGAVRSNPCSSLSGNPALILYVTECGREHGTERAAAVREEGGRLGSEALSVASKDRLGPGWIRRETSGDGCAAVGKDRDHQYCQPSFRTQASRPVERAVQDRASGEIANSWQALAGRSTTRRHARAQSKLTWENGLETRDSNDIVFALDWML